MLLGRGQLRRKIARPPDPPPTCPRNPAEYPAAAVSLRSASLDSFAIVDTTSGELLGTTEAARAFSTVHQGAIYLHLGRSYEGAKLDLERRRALVYAVRRRLVHAAQARDRHDDRERARPPRDARGLALLRGGLRHRDRARLPAPPPLDHAQIDLVPLDLPETSFSTQALWFELDPDALAAACPRPGGSRVGADDETAQETALGALHAAEHAQIAVLPLIAMCDRWDIGGLSTNLHPQTGLPTIFIYDGHPGGVGLTRAAFLRFEELCRDAHRLIAECPCRAGCPSCVQSPKCGNLNEPLAKDGARLLLEGMLAAQAAT